MFSVKNLAKLKLICDDKSLDKSTDKKSLYYQAKKDLFKFSYYSIYTIIFLSNIQFVKKSESL